jgi:hypothetical protein
MFREVRQGVSLAGIAIDLGSYLPIDPEWTLLPSFILRVIRTR